MHIESLEHRRLFSVLDLTYIVGATDYTSPVTLPIVNSLPPISPAPQPRNADLNGDSRVDLADFDYFRQNARSSAANNFIRRSAGPGDADSNGRIDNLDIRALTESFNQYGEWRSGDFTMNGRVTIQDFALAAANVLAK